MVGLAMDSNQNLYVADVWNNRVLMYRNPFTDDAVADAVWGQADFAGNLCNRGQPYQPAVCVLIAQALAGSRSISGATYGWQIRAIIASSGFRVTR